MYVQVSALKDVKFDDRLTYTPECEASCNMYICINDPASRDTTQAPATIHNTGNEFFCRHS
jgi:hypothetical protein